jgi:hypothetical protein
MGAWDVIAFETEAILSSAHDPPPRATPTTNLHVSMVVTFVVVATRPARARVFEWRFFASSECSVVCTVAHFIA